MDPQRNRSESFFARSKQPIPFTESFTTSSSYYSDSKINIHNQSIIQTLTEATNTEVKNIQTNSRNPIVHVADKTEEVPSNTTDLQTDNNYLPEDPSNNSVYLLEVLSRLSSPWDLWARTEKVTANKASGDRPTADEVLTNISDGTVVVDKRHSTGTDLAGFKGAINIPNNVCKAANKDSNPFKFIWTPERSYCNDELLEKYESKLYHEDETSHDDEQSSYYDEARSEEIEKMQREVIYSKIMDMKVKISDTAIDLPSPHSSKYQKRKIKKMYTKSKYRMKYMFKSAGKKWDRVRSSINWKGVITRF